MTMLPFRSVFHGMGFRGEPPPPPVVHLDFDFAAGTYQVEGNFFASLEAVPGYQFTRSGDQGAVDAAGAVSYFAANTPAINDCGYHAYGALTNVILFSCDFDNANWVNSGTLAEGAAVTANQSVAPDGSATMDRVVFGATGADHSRSILVANGDRNMGLTGPHTLSLFAKGTGAGEAIYAGDTPNGGDFAGGEFALTTETRRFSAYLNDVGWVLLGHDRRPPTSARPAETVDLWQFQIIPGHFPDGGPIIRTDAAASTIGASALSVSLADGIYRATYTFDDNTKQVISTEVSDGLFTHPVHGALRRGIVKRVVVTSSQVAT